MKCPFCDNNENRVLEAGKQSKVILSDPRLVKGHLLVVPLRHVEKPWELTDAEVKEIFGFIKKYQQKLSETLGTGCDLRENYRPFLAQSRLKVDHLHYHLIPRTFNDAIYWKTQASEPDIFKDLTDREAEAVIKKLQ